MQKSFQLTVLCETFCKDNDFCLIVCACRVSENTVLTFFIHNIVSRKDICRNATTALRQCRSAVVVPLEHSCQSVETSVESVVMLVR